MKLPCSICIGYATLIQLDIAHFYSNNLFQFWSRNQLRLLFERLTGHALASGQWPTPG